MSRRLAQHHPRRLSRMRPVAQRPTHGLDLALVALRPPSPPEPELGQRADQRALRALAEENALLARELGRVQARCTRWRDDCIAQADRLEALLMRARAEAIAKETQLAALRETLAALQQPSQAPALQGRHVVCVGGRARQMPVYRDLVEQAGGRFSHVDGVDIGCLPGLRRALDEADLVILQPGYACQGACHLVDAHCARLGIRCVRLDKACAIGFARGLELALAAG
jgi:hypothetical protein